MSFSLFRDSMKLSMAPQPWPRLLCAQVQDALGPTAPLFPACGAGSGRGALWLGKGLWAVGSSLGPLPGEGLGAGPVGVVGCPVCGPPLGHAHTEDPVGSPTLSCS